jgi:hypothetical protein
MPSEFAQQQSRTFLGIEVPSKLFARADTVIE